MDDQRFGTTTALADRLGDLRDRIRALRDEETALRAEILRLGGDGPLVGLRHKVSVRRGFRRSLNTVALPAAIRDDPRYWTVTDSCTVVCRPHVNRPEPLRTARPSSPCRDTRAPSQRDHRPRQESLPLPPCDEDPDDIVLIEPF